MKYVLGPNNGQVVPPRLRGMHMIEVAAEFPARDIKDISPLVVVKPAPYIMKGWKLADGYVQKFMAWSGASDLDIAAECQRIFGD